MLILFFSKVLALSVRCSSDLKAHAENWDKANKIYFGPERDLKNFPLQAQPKEVPPTRMGILPKSWFDAFYDKTGVTGKYSCLRWYEHVVCIALIMIDHDLKGNANKER